MPKKPGEAQHSLVVRFPAAWLEELKAEAAERGLSLNGLIVEVLSQRNMRYGGEAAEKAPAPVVQTAKPRERRTVLVGSEPVLAKKPGAIGQHRRGVSFLDAMKAEGNFIEGGVVPTIVGKKP